MIHLKSGLIFLITVGSYLASAAQGYWEHYNGNNGLFQSQLTGIVIEDEENIWLLSDFELSKFNSLTKQFGPTWNTSNSNLVSQNYANLIQANDRIWFSHGNGLTAIDSGNFINYTTANGLLSNDIRDLTVDTAGNLWIASPQGVSHFDGTTFVHDTSVSAYHIAIDDSNRVFIINRRFNILFNNNGPFLTHQVFDGVSWSTPVVTGIGTFPVGILNLKFHQTKEGIFITSKDYDAGAYKLSYPFHLDSVPLFYPQHSNNTTRPFRINNIHIDDYDRKWIISDQDLVLFSGIDSALTPHHLNPEVQKYSGTFLGNEIVTSKGNLMVFSCNSGLFLGYNIRQPSLVERELDSNLIRTSISSLGPLFHDLANNNPLFEFPRGNRTHGIYQAQFIHAHKKITESFFETNLVNLLERTHQIGPVSSKALFDREWVIRMTKAEIDLHIINANNRGYSAPANIKNWPTAGNLGLGVGLELAPFVDIDNNGCYDPDIGDYPYIKGDEALYWINHIGNFEYHGMLYSLYDSASTDLQQTVFVDYTIYNRDTVVYDSVKFGMYVDFDLGNAGDDYVGADSAVSGFFTYNADAFDEGANGYGFSPPSLGVRFLNQKLDGFVSYANGNNYNGTPLNSQHMHHYLDGKWRDGLPISSGGNGRNSGGSTTKIMFSGAPSTGTGWTELGPPMQLLGDRRVIGSIPYFSLGLNGKKTISLAISYGVNNTSTAIASAVPALKNTWNIAKQKWDSTQTSVPSYVAPSCTLLTPISENRAEREQFKIYPNPSSGVVFIETSSFAANSTLRIFNSNGSLLFEQLTNGSTMQFNFSDLPEGMYFVQCGEVSQKLILLNH